MSSSIFEIVDCSDGEMYYPLGIFLSLSEAQDAIGDSQDPPTGLDSDPDCYCKIEIRERDIGWSGHGKRVSEYEWIKDYTKENPEWRRKIK